MPHSPALGALAIRGAVAERLAAAVAAGAVASELAPGQPRARAANAAGVGGAADGPAAAAVVPAAAAAATISPWLPVGASDQGIKGEKCGPEYATEAAVQQAFKPGTHVGYYLANGAPAQY